MNRWAGLQRFSMVAIGVTIAAAACSGSDEPSAETTAATTPVATTTASSSTTTGSTVTSGTTTAVEVRPIDAVVDYYDALNTEDLDSLAALWPSAERSFLEMLTEALHIKVSATCTPSAGSASTIECVEESGRNDFYGPAGVAGEQVAEYTVGDGVIAERRVATSDPAFDAYKAALGEWLEANHQDVYATSYSASGEYPFVTVEQALAVLALLDDFLAQSDTYPLSN